MSELYHPRHLSLALWSVAGFVAVALHAGGVGLALVSMHRDDEPDLSAPAIEIGIELAAPKLDPTDLPIGPDTEAAAPTPAMVEQMAVIEKTDLPKATPTETDDPERVVSPNETERPKDEEPKITAMATPASTESVASRRPRRRPRKSRRKRLFRLLPLRGRARAHGASEQPGKRNSQRI
jgi:periplasmic protein TonB